MGQGLVFDLRQNANFQRPQGKLIEGGPVLDVEAEVLGIEIADAFTGSQFQHDEQGQYYYFDNFGRAIVGDRQNRFVESMSVREFVGGVLSALAVQRETQPRSIAGSALDTAVYRIGRSDGIVSEQQSARQRLARERMQQTSLLGRLVRRLHQ